MPGTQPKLSLWLKLIKGYVRLLINILYYYYYLYTYMLFEL